MRRLILIALFLFIGATSFASDVSEEWEQDLRYETRRKILQLITALDNPSKVRRKFVGELITYGSGSNADLTQRLLLSGIYKNNRQIRFGVLEAMVAIGNPRNVDIIGNALRFDDGSDVRVEMIRLLPVFLVGNNPKLRNEVHKMMSKEHYGLTGRIKKVLRRPPLNPGTGKFDPSLAHIHKRIYESIASQLDPIGGAIEGLGTKKNNVRARKILAVQCTLPLGDIRDDWRDAWRNRGLEYVSAKQPQINEIQLNACMVLADIGAECSPYLVDKMKWLLLLKRPHIQRAAQDSMAELAEVALERAKMMQATKPDTENEREIEWRKRNLAALKLISDECFKEGKKLVNDKNDDLRIGAYKMLGASRKPEAAGITIKAMRDNDESIEFHHVIAQVMGKIGTVEAVKMLQTMSDYRGVSAEPHDQAAEYKRVAVALQSLSKIAGQINQETNVFEVGNIEASRLAMDELLRKLEHNQEISAAPAKENGKRQSVSDLALVRLRRIFDINEPLKSAKEWKSLHEKCLKTVNNRAD